MKVNIQYFEKELRKLPLEILWKIIDELLLPYPNAFDKDTMSYDNVIELCVVLKVSDEIFRELKQIDVLKRRLDEIRV